jgi:uncharacterized protein (TIGR00369 family)
MSEINQHLAAIQQEIGKEFSKSPSPFTHWLKPVVKGAEAGSLIFEYRIRKDMTNPMQVLHGGVSAGIIDDIIGATVFTMNLSHHYTTINNYIDYFAPAHEGDVIEARSSVIKRGLPAAVIIMSAAHVGYSRSPSAKKQQKEDEK